jgi:hypothetical protein
MFKISGNPAGFEDYNVFHKLAQQFLPFAQKKLGFDKPVHINLLSDNQNAKDPLGKTAYYDPNQMKITLFVDRRHVKDILRSMAHELVHHTQNCRGEFAGGLNTDPGYAQNDEHMRKCEGEAYLHGSGFLFRDWEDSQKKLRKENKTMKLTKDTLRQLIKEEWEDYGPPAVDLGAVGASEAYPRGFGDPLSLEDVKRKKKEAWQKMMSAAPEGDWTKLPINSPERQNYRHWRKELMKIKDREITPGERHRSPGVDPHELIAAVDRAQGVRARLRARAELERELKKDPGLAGVLDSPEMEEFMTTAPMPDWAAGETEDEEQFPVFENLEKSIFAPNHYCIHHGGVHHNGQIQMAEAVNHNYNRELNRVTHYDMKLEDGTILENVAAKDIQVTNASLAEEHTHAMKRDDEDELGDPKGDVVVTDEEKVEEGKGHKGTCAEAHGDDPGAKGHKKYMESLEESEESLEEQEDLSKLPVNDPRRREARKKVAKKEQEETNESWTRGNKSKLLFERLTKKWTK